jgi:hypothetical protein
MSGISFSHFCLAKRAQWASSSGGAAFNREAHNQLAALSPFLRACARLRTARSKTIHFLIFIVCWFFGVLAQAAPPPDPAWRTFREHVPGHFQDWIVSGRGPEYTLIYAEPPPAYTLDEYGALLKAVFRGYKDHVVESRKLGYNGEIRDIVIHLDYRAAQDWLSALEHDLAVLSTAIYGKTHGARLIPLKDVEARAATLKAPSPVSVSASDLEDWLLSKTDPITLISPELGVSSNLATLTAAGPAGRYLSSDNSLVVLLIDRARGALQTDQISMLGLILKPLGSF